MTRHPVSPLPPATLGNLLDDGLAVFCWCNRCGHHGELPTAMLAARFGPTLPVPALNGRLRCVGCGGQDVAVRPAWPPRGPIGAHL